MKTPKERVLALLKKYYEMLGGYDVRYDSDEEIDNCLEQRIIIRDLIKYLESK